MSNETNTTTVDSEYSDEAIIAFQGRSGSLSNPPQLGDSRRYVIAGNCVKVSDELQDNGDTKTVCTIKARNVYEIGHQKPDDGAGLFREPCPHCGHADAGEGVTDGEVVDDGTPDDGPAAIGADQLAITAGEPIVDAEVVEDPDADVVDGEVDDDADADADTDAGYYVDGEASDGEPDGLESDGYEPSGMDEFASTDAAEPAGDDQGADDDADAELVDGEPVDPNETAKERKARLQRERRARQRKEREESADDTDGAAE